MSVAASYEVISGRKLWRKTSSDDVSEACSDPDSDEMDRGACTWRHQQCSVLLCINEKIPCIVMYLSQFDQICVRACKRLKCIEIDSLFATTRRRLRVAKILRMFTV